MGCNCKKPKQEPPVIITPEIVPTPTAVEEPKTEGE